ncbi:DUF4405 domain-containing protein [Anaerocolumna xylanovorans]|uniref:Flavinylation-associated cytochrome domain-containing protein n=1 Tax=Anaerocolumna xylanovorans DSM 12503 TaxID=1121345 RepID=A0A1M7Y160_9FIRM|nr:DUF4405 domain-containing protein [Anaerocolumna xylanovorans]SHO45391.1 protein of unknown function [Anaerocolumna xylanovorans DSM 12503]
MNTKVKIKISVDILMTITLFVLMCFQYTGNNNHEVAGAAMLILFLVHNILNRNWYKNLFRGKYTAPRMLQTIVDISMLIVMLLQMISGISMSGYVFTFIPFGLRASTARTIHMLCAYAGFLFMSFHIGLHYGMIMTMFKKMLRFQTENKYRIICLRSVAAGIAVYGIYALIKRDFINYITMQIQFAFFDYEEPVIFFVLDYFAIMGTMVFIAYYLQRWLISKNKEVKKRDAGVEH